MEEKVVGVLATLLKQDAEVVTESLKTEEGVDKIVTSLGELKSFTTEEFGSLKENIRKDEKDSIYNEVKGITLEMVEKNFKKKHSIDWKRGEDYEDVYDLLNKKISEAPKPINGDEQLKKDFDTLQDRYNNLETDNDTKLGDLTSKHRVELSNIHVSSELAKLKPSLDYTDDIVDGQLEMFKIVFNQKYNVGFNEDGVLVVSDKDGNIQKNEDVSPKPLSDVLSEVSKSYLKYKEVVPKGGRGKGTPNEKPLDKTALSKYATFEDYLQSNEGKELQMGGTEMQTKYREWKQAQ